MQTLKDKLSHLSLYPDAAEYIQQKLLQQRLTAAVAAIRKDPASHPLREGLPKAMLHPYQLVGAAFALIGEMMPEAGGGDREAVENLAAVFKRKIGECMETDADGQEKMTVTFSDESVLDQMSHALARIAGAAGKPVSPR